jgi:hypothetical protein
MKRAIKTISIVSYLLIILKGQMVGLPFGVWLILSSFNFGSIDQLFSILAIIGLTLNYSKWKNSIPVIVTSFIFLASPIVSRMVQVPIEMFDYLAFEIPLVTFVLAYMMSISINVVERMRTTRAISHADNVDDTYSILVPAHLIAKHCKALLDSNRTSKSKVNTYKRWIQITNPKVHCKW